MNEVNRSGHLREAAGVFCTGVRKDISCSATRAPHGEQSKFSYAIDGKAGVG